MMKVKGPIGHPPYPSPGDDYASSLVDFEAANRLVGHRVLVECFVPSRNRYGVGPEYETLAVSLRVEGVVETWESHDGVLTYEITGFGKVRPDAIIDLGPFDYTG